MKYIGLVVIIFSLLFSSCKREESIQYDICIYGGTSAGVIAAYTASVMGKSVLLIEPGKHLGGLSTGGLGYTDIGNKYAITGLSRDFYRRLGKHYGKFEQWIFEPHVAENLFQEYIRRGQVEVLYEHRVTEALKEDGLIKNIVVENSTAPEVSTNKVISAKMFIDCSYEGDLMARAGVSYFVGRESNEQYKETYNGVQLMTGHQFPDGIDPYKVPGDSSSGLLWGISDGTLEPDGTGDKKVQAYNFRICLTEDPSNRVSITRPEGYDSTKYELLLRLFEALPEKRTLNDYMIVSKMPNRKTDINNRGGFSTDMIGMNHDYPEADYTRREEILQQHITYTKGLLYFYGHDPRVPEVLRNEMLQWGYPKDEYTDNGHWSRQMYVREARRMIGSYVMTQANCEGKEIVSDGVGMAAYTMDSHNCQRLIVNGMVKNEGNVEIGGFGPYPVSYRALIPKAEECKNLLVPVCLSATHIAYGSIRMEPVFMALAQSTAVAACLAIDNNQSVQQVDVLKVQALLKENPLADGSTPEILVDNDDTRHISLTGEWKTETQGGYGPTLLTDDSNGKVEKSVTFSPTLVKSGAYSVYAYFPLRSGASSQTLIMVYDGESNHEVVIKKEDIQVEGQTSGEWVSLGRYDLSEGSEVSVVITNRNANGLIVADAVLFVPGE